MFPNDFMTDGPLPCTPDCTKICELERGCGIISSGQVQGCINTCQASPTKPELLCLGQLACQPPPPNCVAAKACISNPKVPDLTVTHSVSSPAAGQILFMATVCNKGTGDAKTFRVHFYRNLSSPPTSGQPGDIALQPPAGPKAGQCR